MKITSILVLVAFLLTLSVLAAVDTHTFASSEKILPKVEYSAIGGSGNHSTALAKDGTLWSCGDNYYGQLGNGSVKDSNIPMQVRNLSGVAVFACGPYHSVAIKNDGSVWVWGRNVYGQLGDGTLKTQYIPTQLAGFSGVKAAACGEDSTYVLKNDGMVWSWGKSDYGQLGDGTGESRSAPVQVQGLSGIIAITHGTAHGMALKDDGTVWAWGDNSFGQLGLGSSKSEYDNKYKDTPTQVQGLTDVKSIACGNYNSAAIKSDGTLWVWGSNSFGQLGGGTQDRYSPTQILGLKSVKSVAFGLKHIMVLKSDGTVWGLGSNDYGQIGNKTSGFTDVKKTLTQVFGLAGVSSITCGEHHTLALKNDGTVWGWGSNGFGQLGDGTFIDKNVPVQIFITKSSQEQTGVSTPDSFAKIAYIYWEDIRADYIHIANKTVGATVIQNFKSNNTSGNTYITAILTDKNGKQLSSKKKSLTLKENTLYRYSITAGFDTQYKYNGGNSELYYVTISSPKAKTIKKIEISNYRVSGLSNILITEMPVTANLSNILVKSDVNGSTKGFTLSPVFSKDKTEYTVIIDKDTDLIEINVKPESFNAEVTINEGMQKLNSQLSEWTGLTFRILLEKDETKIPISVKSPDGKRIKTYILKVKRNI